MKRNKMKLLILLPFLFSISANIHAQENESDIDAGHELVVNRKMGNCLACHMIQGEDGPGYFGPPLISMQARFPDREVLFNQIWDATIKNPNTSMPPFGKNMILSKQEIDKIVIYLLTL